MSAGLAWLDRTQAADGGWGHAPDAPGNVNSTAYALQGLIAAGEDPRGPRDDARGADPVGFLLAQQLPDGRFGFDTSPADLVRHAAGAAGPRRAQRARAEPPRRQRRRHCVDPGPRADPRGWLRRLQPRRDDRCRAGPGRPGPRRQRAGASGKTPTEYLTSQAERYAGRGASAAGKLAGRRGRAGRHGPRLRRRGPGGGDRGPPQRHGHLCAGGTWDTAWAILGLAAAGAPFPEPAARGLLAAASPVGGWGFGARAAAPDVDSTGLALQALRAAALPDGDPAVAATVGAALAYLRGRRVAGGGFLGYGDTVNTESIALAIGGLVAWGQDVNGPAWMWAPGAGLARRSPVEGLLALHRPGGGFLGFTGPDDPSATYAALFALSLRPLPLVPRRFARPVVFLPMAVARR